MTRKLHKCPCCKEWFNTTDAIMMKHWQERHERPLRKAIELGSLAMKKCAFQFQAAVTPWPMNMQYIAAAAMTQAQIDTVMAAPAS